MSGHAQGAARFSALAKNLEALSSPTRLELLHALRTPQALHEIRVHPTLSREGETKDRPLSRQGVTRHIDQLLDLGLLVRLPGDDAEGARGERFVLNHERLFAVIDDVRNLSKLRPLSVELGPHETIHSGHDERARLPPPPRLLLAYGRDDGVAYSLADGTGARTRIGRGAGCEVRLDYDPFLSAEHAVIEHGANGFVVRDLESRNGTSVNWRTLSRGETRVLAPGDLLTVGRSILAFQA